MLAEIIDALVLQTYTVEHALCGFGHTRIVVTLARNQCCAFYNNATYLVEGHEVGKLDAVAEGSRRGHHGVLHPQLS